MSDNELWFLENSSLDTALSPDKMKEVNIAYNKVRFKKGDYIYLPSDNSDKIFFILSGKIKIGSYRNLDKEIVKAFLQKGDVFGELSIIGENKRKDFAQAMEESEICIIPLAEVKKLSKDHPRLSIMIMKMMGSRVLEMEQRLESLVFKDSKTRILEFIISSVEKNGQRVGFEWVLRNFLTHQDIASLTATSRQTATMALIELNTANIIHFDTKIFPIRDIEKIREMVK
ncbi:MAG: Crp/Fnr family transcriptional regulator [Saprospiraceae bacterium]|nr:Crp/Fnr family transcriptional regulator [Saprospiraceae bacterium]